MDVVREAARKAAAVTWNDETVCATSVVLPMTIASVVSIATKVNAQMAAVLGMKMIVPETTRGVPAPATPRRTPVHFRSSVVVRTTLVRWSFLRTVRPRLKASVGASTRIRVDCFAKRTPTVRPVSTVITMAVVLKGAA